MRRPAWASAGSFSQAWAALERSDDPGELSVLAGARPLVVDREQVEALPLQVDQGDPPKLPFDPLFIDLGGADFQPTEYGNFDPEALPNYAASGYQAQAVLLSEIPSLRLDVFLRDSAGRVEVAGAFEMGESEGGFWSLRREAERFDGDEEHVLTWWSAQMALSVLGWLQSFNVELVEAQPSRQERRAVERAGGQVALTVQVKQSKQSISRSPTNGKANYSHRFETRGRYNHHFEEKADGTPNKVFAACRRKDPSRLVTVDGKPCFKFWQPPFVTGPVDKPFVPKVRVAAETPKAA